MSKQALVLFLSFYFFSCSSFKNPNVAKNQYGLGTKYTLNYPPGWYSFDWHNRLNFAPKKIRNSYINVYDNSFSIIEFSNTKDIHSLKELVQKLMNTTKKAYDLYDSKIIESSDDRYVIHTNKKGYSNSYKTIQHFYKHKGKYYLLEYMFIDSHYDKYLDEAKVIFNSFKFLD